MKHLVLLASLVVVSLGGCEQVNLEDLPADVSKYTDDCCEIDDSPEGMFLELVSEAAFSRIHQDYARRNGELTISHIIHSENTREACMSHAKKHGMEIAMCSDATDVRGEE